MNGICCIEWAEKISASLPSHTTCVSFSYINEKTRQIEILNLEKAIKGDKEMQDFELESFPIGVDHSQKVKSPSTAVSRLKSAE